MLAREFRDWDGENALASRECLRLEPYSNSREESYQSAGSAFSAATVEMIPYTQDCDTKTPSPWHPTPRLGSGNRGNRKYPYFHPTCLKMRLNALALNPSNGSTFMPFLMRKFLASLTGYAST